MPSTFTTQRRVEWRDTDAAGIMHFSTFFTFMEEAEHELLRSLGLSVSMDYDDAHISFPRVAAKCDFSQPLKFEDLFAIKVSVERLGTKSVTYAFQFVREENEIANGTMTCVCCNMDESPPRSIPLPASVTAKLKAFLR